MWVAVVSSCTPAHLGLWGPVQCQTPKLYYLSHNHCVIIIIIIIILQQAKVPSPHSDWVFLFRSCRAQDELFALNF